MGYSDRFLSSVVLGQAVILALMGFLPGLAVSEILYVATAWKTRLPLDMTLLADRRRAGIVAWSCAPSPGWWPCGSCTIADPADLY